MKFITIHPNQPLVAYVLEQKQQLTVPSSGGTDRAAGGGGGTGSNNNNDSSNQASSSNNNINNTNTTSSNNDSNNSSGGTGNNNKSTGNNGGGNKDVSGGGNARRNSSSGGSISGNTVSTMASSSTTGDEASLIPNINETSSSTTSVKAAAATGPSIITKIIQVQHLQTRNVIWSLSFGDLANLLFGNKAYSPLSKDAPKRYNNALKLLGRIRSIRFFDPSTLYYSGMQMTKEKENHHQQQPQQNNNNHLHNDRWQTLLIHFTNRIVMLNLRKGPFNSVVAFLPKLTLDHPSPLMKNSTMTAYSSILCHLHGERTSSSSKNSNAAATNNNPGFIKGTSPSSNALPITDSLLLFGCYDGTFICYDWKKGVIVTVIKGLGKNDYFTIIIPSTAKSSVLESVTITGGDNNESIGDAAAAVGKKSKSSSKNNSNIITYKRRLIVLTKKAIAYLVELTVQKDIAKNKVLVDIRPPLVQFEGGAPFLDDDNYKDKDGSSLSSSYSSSSSTPPRMEHNEQLIKFDKERQLFLWCSPIHKNNRIPQVLCWDLARMESKIQSQLKQQDKLALGNSVDDHKKSGGSNSKQKISRPEPMLIVQFPFLSDVGILPGWSHPSYPENALISAIVTSSGEIHIMGANLNTGGTIGATPVDSTNIEALLQRDTGLADVDFASMTSQQRKRASSSLSSVKSHYIGCPVLWDSNTLVVASNIGLMMIDFDTSALVPGPRHYHLGAGLGTLGKSVLFINHSTIGYGSIDSFKPNPIGYQKPKNPVDIYESSVNVAQLPFNIRKRPYRMPPSFLPSPSGVFVCLFWNEEMRYEILHIPTLLQPVGSLGSRNKELGGSFNQSVLSNNKSCVASGTGIRSFAWVTEHDIYCVLHAPQLSHELGQYSDIAAPCPPPMSTIIEAAGQGGFDKITTTGKVGITKVKDGAVKSAGVLKYIATLGLADKIGKKKSKDKAAAAAAAAAAATQEDEEGNKGSSADIGHAPTVSVLGGGAEAGGIATMPLPSGLNMDSTASHHKRTTPQKKPWVEFRILEYVDIDETKAVAAATGKTAVPVTSKSLDELQLRGGNRVPPLTLFSGPVLCVASRPEGSNGGNGYAHFYSIKKKINNDNNNPSTPKSLFNDNHSVFDDESKASTPNTGSSNKNLSAAAVKVNPDDYRAFEWISSGPTMPFPDFVVWDDDGRLCAVVIHNRVAIYLSEEPDFVLLGFVRAGVPSDPDGNVTSAKFVHGVLYCCTRNSIQCVFLGDTTTSSENGICHLDSYILVSTDVPSLPADGPSIVGLSYSSLTPPTLPMNLCKPYVLGYQNGSLMTSTSRGLVAIPLLHPLLRIGSLLAAGQVTRAARWFHAVPESDHEELANFLERRGAPENAIELPGLSLETVVDFCMRYGYIDRLEDVVESYGVKGLRTIDMGRGVTTGDLFGPEEYSHSIVVCVGAYLLSYGRIELVRQIISECLRLVSSSTTNNNYSPFDDEIGCRKDALILSALLLNINTTNTAEDANDDLFSVGNGNSSNGGSGLNMDALRLIARAVEGNRGNNDQNPKQPNNHNQDQNDWIIGNYVRDYLLPGFPASATTAAGAAAENNN